MVGGFSLNSALSMRDMGIQINTWEGVEAAIYNLILCGSVHMTPA